LVHSSSHFQPIILAMAETQIHYFGWQVLSLV